MTYKQIGKIATVVSSTALLGSTNIRAEKPNIILIMTDQQTADAMSNRGNPYLSTPGMDMLAKDGVTFTNAYCSYPLSGPSRASLFTGKMPVELNVTNNDIPLSDEDTKNSLGFIVKDAGYDCLYAGKWHVPTIEMPDGEFGFQTISGMHDPTLVQNIKGRLAEKRAKPLFLVASFLNPHEICEYARTQTLHYGEIDIPEEAKLPPLPANFNADKDLPESVKLHKDMMIKLYPTRNYSKLDWQKYVYSYYRLVERVDKSVYDLIMELKKNNLYDNSLIIFTSDHGDGVAAHKWNQKIALFEETINIPLIVKLPSNQKGLAAGSVTGALTNIGLDIYSTVCDFAGAAIPSDRNGKSMKDVVLGKSDKQHDHIFIETLLDGVNIRGWCVIEGDYKYVFYRIFKQREQLFNLAVDKGETKNLIANPKFIEKRNHMRKLMREYSIKTGDKQLQKDLQFF
ncbi:sulfatase-like hydrolase/transferase [Paludibacter sp.]